MPNVKSQNSRFNSIISVKIRLYELQPGNEIF